MLGSGRDPLGDIEGGVKEAVLRRALYKGHFLLSSGLHSEYYFEKFRILEDPKLLRKFSEVLARKLKDFDVEWVVGPFTGGAIFAYDLASVMGVFSAYAEKEGERRVLKRGYNIENRRVAVVDDVLTTGKSLRETYSAVLEAGGIPVVCGVMIKRGEISLEVPLFFVLELNLPVFKPEDCPLCKAGIPLEIRGKGGL